MVMVVLLYAGFRGCDGDSLVEWARFTSVELVYQLAGVIGMGEQGMVMAYKNGVVWMLLEEEKGK